MVVKLNNEVETIDIVSIEKDESYALRFVPKCAGNYYIRVTLDGAPMRDSPFRIRVGGVDGCGDSTAVNSSEGSTQEDSHWTGRYYTIDTFLFTQFNHDSMYFP
ncbi:hypothetical protein WR25_15459 [Diploscapter pachys]|uniref:Uncharacterized protein n=1 Tax=Diploscapter pachys TaxID=2018661 RepID=A0A2A2KBE4_9BILA|nr:hypothetical protein WR25_15459 [Diploscapter pachys]